MKVRPASTWLSLDEALEQTAEITSRTQLVSYLRSACHFYNATEENVTIAQHGGFDEQTGWDTYLICVNGVEALYSDGPLEEPSVEDEHLSPLGRSAQKAAEGYLSVADDIKAQQARVQERNEFVRQAAIQIFTKLDMSNSFSLHEAWGIAINLWNERPEGF